jgi:integrase/recombinase XerD
MNITFRLEYNPAKDLKQSKPVFIRCTQNRKHKRIHTGVSVSSVYWNKQKQQVRKTHPQYQVYNLLIQTQLKQVLETYHHLMSTHKELNLQTLTEALQGKEQEDFFVFAFSTKMQEIKSRNKLGTYRRYETALNKFQVFTSGKLPIQQINYSLLKQYENHLITHHKNSRDTVSANLSVIRTIINEAIRYDLYKGRNPFDMFKLTYTDNTKEKLTLDEIHRFIHAPIPAIPSLLLARDFFYACFLAEGTRAGDMIGMKKEYLQQGCLVFAQQKTGAKMMIPVVPELMEIFNRYHSTEGIYIFPFLNKEAVVNEIIIGNKLAYINKFIKEVCKYAGILKKVSSHVARHTYTDIALQVSGGNIYQVQQSLGHSSVKTTEIYSRNRVNYTKQSMFA